MYRVLTTAAGEVRNLIETHPDIVDVFDGFGTDRATTVFMRGRSFQSGLDHLVNSVARIGVLRGNAVATTEVDEFLVLAGKGELPFYEVRVIHGLSVESEVSLASNLKLTSYEDAVERGFGHTSEDEILGFSLLIRD